MSREVDRRDFSVSRATEERATGLERVSAEVSSSLPGAHTITVGRLDEVTGNAALVESSNAPAEEGNYVRRALQHVNQISPTLGLASPAQTAEFVADPTVQETSSGAHAVNLQQRYKGIPVFQAAQTVRFDASGALSDTVGTSVSVTDDLPVSPKLRTEEAVLRAAQYCAVPDADEQGQTDDFGQPLEHARVELDGWRPTVLAKFTDKADQPAVLEPGPFGDEFKASLVWFPLGDGLRLAYDVLVTMPEYQGQYRTVVDADDGEILYCRQLVVTVRAVGNVYRRDGGSPRERTDFPRALGDYGLPLPPNRPLPQGFPEDWISADSCVGNSTNAHLSDVGATMQGAVQNGVLTFDPTDAVGDDQKVLNIFYYCCYMHDFFYLLGFRENDGNFQQDDFGRGGVQGDAVDARSWPGTVFGTANMSRTVDGSQPVMNMGLVASTNRHTAFDSTVVFHEFTHGVSNRLVGGAINANSLSEPQSGGMGEGWSDYTACTINDKTVVGDWVVNRPQGIRGFPYTESFPDSFADLGTGRYNEVHNNGEIWCATLVDLNRRIGKILAFQIVVDALKLTPSNPSFLDARDAILAAARNMRIAGQLDAEQYRRVWRRIWWVFARFGMGPRARSTGPQLVGIVGDFTTPNEVIRSTHSGFLVQGNFGTKGNFELVAPASSGNGLVHRWRNNDDPALPWSAQTPFGAAAGHVDTAALLQSNFGEPGNLEVVARVGDRLAHFWRDSGPSFTWHGPAFFGSGASGNPALVQGFFGSRGNFELVVPQAGGGLAHYWRNNDDPALPWNGPTVFGSGPFDDVALIQGNWGDPGNLEVVARRGSELVHFWRDSGPSFTWHGPTHVANGVSGTPSLVQGNFGRRGNLEVVVPCAPSGLAHFWRNDEDPAFPWSGPAPFGPGVQAQAASVVQGNYGDPGNLEVAALVGGGVSTFWRDAGPEFAWHGPFPL